MIVQRAATHIFTQIINSRCERATDQDLRLPTEGPVRKLVYISNSGLLKYAACMLGDV